MQLTNTENRYGAVTKGLHWSVFVLFVYQYVGANLMTRIGRDDRLLGLAQGSWYNGHKSVGLVLLALALLRLGWRRLTVLPDWAEALTPAERAIAHRTETLLYGSMLLLPVSGYLFVMAGGYGVKLFGLWDLPNPLGKEAITATAARVAHVLLAYLTVVAVSWHIGLGLKKQLFDGARFLQRMLPFQKSGSENNSR